MVPTNRIKYIQVLSGTPMVALDSKKKRYFTAQEVASLLGISKQTLLRYEARGVFPKANRNRVNRWREYTPVDIRTLRKLIGR